MADTVDHQPAGDKTAAVAPTIANLLRRLLDERRRVLRLRRRKMVIGGGSGGVGVDDGRIGARGGGRHIGGRLRRLHWRAHD